MSANEYEVNLYGFGVYVGDEIPPHGIQMAGIDMHEAGAPNPKIILDSGKVVFGCECWWGDEVTIKNKIGKRRVVNVDIDERRRKANES